MADKVKAVLGILAVVVFVLVFSFLDQVLAFIFAGVVAIICAIAIGIQHARNKPPQPPHSSS